MAMHAKTQNCHRCSLIPFLQDILVRSTESHFEKNYHTPSNTTENFLEEYTNEISLMYSIVSSNSKKSIQFHLNRLFLSKLANRLNRFAFEKNDLTFSR